MSHLNPSCAATRCENLIGVNIHFVGQPFKQQRTLLDFIEHAKDGGFDELKITVAWAKRSGLGRIWDALEEFRSWGGTVTLIVGVSEGGATREGLELALQASDASYVFHDPRRTFHPKVYFASSSGQRSLLVGSSNLTAGGLAWNYEASVWMEFKADEGHDLTDAVDEWFDSLILQTQSCKPLTTALIEEIQNSSDITLGSESRTRRAQGKTSDTPEDNDSMVPATISGLFKPVVDGLKKLPGLSAKIAPKANPSTGARPRIPQSSSKPEEVKDPTRASAAPFQDDGVQRRWFKLMDSTAAQQVKSKRSHPTGNLRLSQADAPVNHTRYFRNDFFGGLPWTPRENMESELEVYVGFQTWIDGKDLGIQELRISHNPQRISGQGNVPTILHWGAISSLLRETNYVGMYITLERIHSGTFNLIISQEPRGDYLP